MLLFACHFTNEGAQIGQMYRWAAWRLKQKWTVLFDLL
jgi:hypothetical protein